MKDVYPVHEMFHTFQGEGVHMGKPAFFIRLYGCPVHCPWCDSAGTWHPEWVPKDVTRMPTADLVAAAVESTARHVVITGGEPCMHDLQMLISGLTKVGLFVAVETSGAFPILGNPHWITLSPKKWKKPIQANFAVAHEFKFIIETPADIEFYAELIMMRTRTYEHVWLHPEWRHRDDRAVLNAITEACKLPNSPFRAGWQIHKLYNADVLDSRSRKLTPLGGDPKNGY